MSADEIAAPRLFVEAPLAEGAAVALDRAQANYLLNVLRLKAGAAVLVFNGRDGEWLARVTPEGRKSAALGCERRLKPQTEKPRLTYLFAPLKHARLDYMVQKATEMGAGRLVPVLTRRTQVSRVNHERMRANVIEAAEQCELLVLPDIEPEQRLDQALAALEPLCTLIFCDEEAPLADPVAALSAADVTDVAVLIGPEGGFSPEERAALLKRERIIRLSLGPRILRADTAAVAAIALVQATLGDWRERN